MAGFHREDNIFDNKTLDLFLGSMVEKIAKNEENMVLESNH